MVCEHNDVSPDGIIKHYGYMKHMAGEVKRDELLEAGVADDFIQRQLTGLAKWIECAEAGLVMWGWFILRKIDQPITAYS